MIPACFTGIVFLSIYWCLEDLVLGRLPLVVQACFADDIAICPHRPASQHTIQSTDAAPLIVGLSPEVGCRCRVRGRCLQLSQRLFPLGPAGVLRHACQEFSTPNQILVVALTSLRDWLAGSFGLQLAPIPTVSYLTSS